ncbi:MULTISPECIES: hypothetical protein [Haemophilus]|uniref:Stress protein, tellurium resistance protein TerZ n=3 Tax=Haemophilus TaxID=724 RepID=A0A3S4Z7Q2_HAEPA|nr:MULTISPECIES: hypothetical protein [Haemophilus]KAB1992624.1 hypothetical protein F8M38_01390 [Haemophilus parainfluenzae]OOR95884.1 hypothetical protein B0184_02630 [Haemophilus paraphrohaemolyticus]QAT94793.1 hypothetical protein ERO09_01755 [Haemophilus parainfluenzae]STP00335.1 Uncharacterised protein [Haemophilus paraphrohaemolyticus]VEI29238.1 Uncharacterised protein [Haemophilus parainfluenzae]
MVTKKLILLSIGLISINTMANQYYVAPPTSSTRGHVPVISDEQMEKCVEIYNQSKWLGDSLQNTYVDQYSSASVNAYNQKIAQHSQMINWFNQNCAGKQSRSACEAAMELNRKNGIPTQNCY